MPEIKVRENEPFENALRRFKNQCKKTGILRELKERKHHDKPSIKRKRKAKAAKRKNAQRSF